MSSRGALYNGPVTIQPGEVTNLRLRLHSTHHLVMVGVGKVQSGETALVAVYGEQTGLEYLPQERIGCEPVLVPVAGVYDDNILVVFSPDEMAVDPRTVTVVVAAS